MSNKEREIRRKMRVFEHARESGNVQKTCRYFGVPSSVFYFWRERYQREGEAGLARKKPIARTYPIAIAPEIVEKVLQLATHVRRQLNPESRV